MDIYKEIAIKFTFDMVFVTLCLIILPPFLDGESPFLVLDIWGIMSLFGLFWLITSVMTIKFSRIHYTFFTIIMSVIIMFIGIKNQTHSRWNYYNETEIGEKTSAQWRITIHGTENYRDFDFEGDGYKANEKGRKLLEEYNNKIPVDGKDELWNKKYLRYSLTIKALPKDSIGLLRLKPNDYKTY